ncbi:TPA: hypothetical protein ACOAY7_002959 [Vibrio cholerae]
MSNKPLEIGQVREIEVCGTKYQVINFDEKFVYTQTINAGAEDDKIYRWDVQMCDRDIVVM